MTTYETDERATTERTLDEHLELARRTYVRVDVAEAAALVRDHDGVLVDIRPVAQRAEEGSIEGALVIERNVLEWRIAPSSDHRLAAFDDPLRPVIVFCSAGYASSFAAASLRAIGVIGATDLIGGFQAWRAEGLPVASRGLSGPST